MKEIFLSLLFVAAGVFSIAGSYFNWEFFFNNRKAKRLINIIGMKATRIFYFVLGIIIFLGGVVSLFIRLNLV